PRRVFLRGRLARVKIAVHADELRKVALAGDVALDDVEGRRAHVRAQLDRRVRVGVHHRLEDIRDRVDGDDQDVLAGVETCLLDGQCRADRHLVVVRPDGADTGAAVLGLEHGLHDFLALAARDLAGLRAYYPRVRVARVDPVHTLHTDVVCPHADPATQ